MLPDLFSCFVLIKEEKKERSELPPSLFGGNSPTIFMMRLCSLAEPTGPAQLSSAYLYILDPGRGVFQHLVRDWNGGAP
jgi:hypothetical protein